MQFVSAQLDDVSRHLLASVQKGQSPTKATQEYKGDFPVLFDGLAATLGYTHHVQQQDAFLKRYAYFIGNAVQEKQLSPTGEYHCSVQCLQTATYPVRDIDGRDRFFFLKENSDGGVNVLEVDNNGQPIQEIAKADNLNFEEIRKHFTNFEYEFNEPDRQHTLWSQPIPESTNFEFRTADGRINHLIQIISPLFKNRTISEDFKQSIIRQVNHGNGKAKLFCIFDRQFKLLEGKHLHEMQIYEVKGNGFKFPELTTIYVGSVPNLTFGDFKSVPTKGGL